MTDKITFTGKVLGYISNVGRELHPTDFDYNSGVKIGTHSQEEWCQTIVVEINYDTVVTLCSNSDMFTVKSPTCGYDVGINIGNSYPCTINIWKYTSLSGKEQYVLRLSSYKRHIGVPTIQQMYTFSCCVNYDLETNERLPPLRQSFLELLEYVEI